MQKKMKTMSPEEKNGALEMHAEWYGWGQKVQADLVSTSWTYRLLHVLMAELSRLTFRSHLHRTKNVEKSNKDTVV
jgi:hypothetical protein